MSGTVKVLAPQGGVDETLAAVNERLAMAGLSIARDDALMLAERRAESLAEVERVEFGQPAVVAIAEALVSVWRERQARSHWMDSYPLKPNP